MAKAKDTAAREGFLMLTIEVPQSIVVESRNGRGVLDVSQLSPEIAARLFEQGCETKVGNSGAGSLAEAGFGGMKFKDLPEEDQAKVTALSNAAMEETIANLYAGTWAERRAGAGPAVDPITKARRSIIRGDVAKSFGKDAWKALSEEDQNLAMDNAYLQQDDAVRAEIDAAAQADVEAAKAERARKAALPKLALKR